MLSLCCHASRVRLHLICILMCVCIWKVWNFSVGKMRVHVFTRFTHEKCVCTHPHPLLLCYDIVYRVRHHTAGLLSAYFMYSARVGVCVMIQSATRSHTLGAGKIETRLGNIEPICHTRMRAPFAQPSYRMWSVEISIEECARVKKLERKKTNEHIVCTCPYILL